MRKLVFRHTLRAVSDSGNYHSNDSSGFNVQVIVWLLRYRCYRSQWRLERTNTHNRL
jgi:hypothetical protein